VATPLFTKTNKPEIKRKITIGRRAGDVRQTLGMKNAYLNNVFISRLYLHYKNTP
jgi:hypothetical protein